MMSTLFRQRRAGVTLEPLSASRMEKSRKMFVCVLLFVLAMESCSAQHWSYGLQPGGKRSAENLLESLQEIAHEMEKLGEAQKSECPGSTQHSRLGELKEAVPKPKVSSEHSSFSLRNLAWKKAHKLDKRNTDREV